VEIADDASLQTTYLAQFDGTTLAVTVGPVLQRKYQGLTADEELKKHSEFYLANLIWMANRPGVGLAEESTYVDGYAARITKFRGVRRDLAGVGGDLAVLLTPWGDSVPVTCVAKQGEFEQRESTCTRILNLVRMKRVDN
jgi:hypothetical protein